MYTHYWKRPAEIELVNFKRISAGLLKSITLLRKSPNIRFNTDELSGSKGQGLMVIGADHIVINGKGKHRRDDFVLDRIISDKDPLDRASEGMISAHCTTDHQQYDVLVQCALFLLKLYQPKSEINTDGVCNQWMLAINVVRSVLRLKGFTAQELFDLNINSHAI
jgi:hypothetical protein